MTPTTQDAGLALLPCPFCGGKAGKPSIGGNPSDERSGYNYTVTVMCSECGATKTVHSKRGKGGWCDENTEDTIQRAAAAWNTRPLADRLEQREGWVMVPREPTEAMVAEGWAKANDPGPNALGVITDTECVRIWTAMLSYRPPAPEGT